VSVTAGATDTAGNGLSPALASTFTTGQQPDLTPPTVYATSPVDGANNVAVDAPIAVTFSEAMDTTSVESAFRVTPATPGSFNWSDNSTTVTFTPAAALQYDTSYRVTIGETAHDAAAIPNALTGGAEFHFQTVQVPVSDTVIELDPGRFARPRRYDDSWVTLTAPITVRIPTMQEIAVMKDGDGNLLGDADRFLMVLHLGRVRCMYLAGKWDRHVGGFVERVFEENFQSPVCNGDNLRGGSLVTISPDDVRGSRRHRGDGDRDGRDRDGRDRDGRDRDDRDRDGRDRDDRDRDGNRNHGDRSARSGAQIRARIISANPRFPETRLQVTIEVTAFTAPLPPVMSDSPPPVNDDSSDRTQHRGDRDSGESSNRDDSRDKNARGRDSGSDDDKPRR